MSAGHVKRKAITSTCKLCGETFTYFKGRGRDRLYCSQRCARKTKPSHAVGVTPETRKRLDRIKKHIERSGLAATYSGLLARAVRLLAEKEGIK